MRRSAPCFVEGAEQARRQGGFASGALDEQRADPPPSEPPQDELERRPRGPVEPLDVVHRDHDGCLLRELGEERAEGRVHDPGLRRVRPRRRPEQSDLERLTLRRGEPSEGVVGRDGDEDVREACVRELRLGLRGPAGEDLVSPRLRALDGCAADGGLADPRLAPEDEHGRASRDGVEKALRGLELEPPANHAPEYRNAGRPPPLETSPLVAGKNGAGSRMRSSRARQHRSQRGAKSAAGPGGWASTTAPRTARAMPSRGTTRWPVGAVCSTTMTRVSAPIQAGLATPAANMSSIGAQQQPRQKSPCSRPTRNAARRPRP